MPGGSSMDPEQFRSRMGDLALGSAMAAAARDLQKEMLASEKAGTGPAHDEVDLDELLDDPELERLHSERIAQLKKEAEKRQVLQLKGHGEYREIAEGDFLAEVTETERVVCHFFHREFVRCKIMDKHLNSLTAKYFDTKFIKVDAENCPFFVTKLAVKVLPCVILFRNGVALDRLVGFQQLGDADDFPVSRLENYLIKSGIIVKQVRIQDEDDAPRRVRSSAGQDSDSD